MSRTFPGNEGKTEKYKEAVKNLKCLGKMKSLMGLQEVRVGMVVGNVVRELHQCHWKPMGGGNLAWSFSVLN